ncbi:MAG: polymorphic toxin-type HINT domain-containing protein [archaeon]
MVLDPKQKHKLKKFVRKLENIRGRHTELVTVYIPAGYDINKIINHLGQEQGTATNIKDKTTQKHVIDSLERMIRHLRLFKKTPDNGLAAFAGNATDKEGKLDVQVWSIEPPEAINNRIYRCDQTFQLDILREMLDVKETYGLIVVDRREATIGLLKGTNIVELQTLTSGVPGKTRAGGQCLAFDTEIAMADGQFLSLEEVEVGDEVLSYDFESKTLKPSEVLDKWVKPTENIYKIHVEEIVTASKDHLFFLLDGLTKASEELQVGDLLLGRDGSGKEIKKIEVDEQIKINLIDISVANKNFVAEGLIVHNSAQRFARIREGAAKDFYKRIAETVQKEFLEMKTLKGILIGGPGPTKETFYNGDFLNNQIKLKVLGLQDLSYTGDFGLKELVNKSQEILSKEAIIEEKKILEKFFKLLSTDDKRVSYGKKQVEKVMEMAAVETLLLSESLDEDYIEKMEDDAENSRTEVKIISTDTMEGQQLEQLGGIAAILRYPID